MSAKKYKNIVFGCMAFVLAVASIQVGFIAPRIAEAAGITSFSDNLSRLQVSTLADHTVQFITPTGIAVNKTVTFTFGSPGFSVGSFALGNFKFFIDGTAGTCSSGTFAQQTLAATPTGTSWGIGSSGNIITLTSPTTTVTSSVNTCVRMQMGSVAGGSSFITNSATPGDSSATLTIGGTFGDSGTAFIPIISNDQVTLTATVNPTLTFTLSQNSLGFGTLTSANGRWATNAGGAAVATSGLSISASTNAATGYTIYVVGPTLTSGSNTITPLASSTASSPGTSQFGLNATVSSAGSGSPTISSPYGTASQYAYTATSTQTPVATTTAPDSGTTYAISYLANISPVTPAGTYAATHTWTAVGNF